MSSENFVIYRSSAGSGKTYTLTKEYLKLALKNPKYYKHILAVTFTNKAMQEMKNRIIQKLDEFAHNKFDEMAEELMQSSQLDGPEFQVKCREILTKILHGYSHFSISTIDAFFQKVIRSFAKELGLAGSYRLELDQDIILIQIVDNLLLEVTENKQIRNWIIRFARENLQEGNNWDIRRNIKDLARELFNENFKEIEDEIAEKDRSLTEKLKVSVDEIIGIFENKMHQLGCEGLALLEKHNLAIEDFSYSYSGPMGHLVKICKDKKTYEPGKRLVRALEGGSWYTKTSKKAEIIDNLLASGLEDLLHESVLYFEEQHTRYATAFQIKQFLYGYGLLADLTHKLQEYKSENEVMLISDATRFLKELVQDTDTPFVYEKIGSFYNHYLIDEFQDTSGFQWDSFRPLVDDSLAQGYKNLVVGDIKQSIYRWRGGDWELLLNKIENDIGANKTFNKVLDTNFRSEANIVRFNNSLFKLMPSRMIALGGEENGSWQVLGQVYQDTYQKVPEQKLKHSRGYVNVTFFKEEKDEKWKDQVAEKLPLLVEELQDKGIPLKEIAILVRRNSEGKEVSDILAQYQKSGLAKSGYRYDVVSNESLFLYSSPAVRVIIAALRYLYDKKDKVVKAELVYEYQKAIKKNNANLSELFQSIRKNDFFQWLPARFFDLQHQLLYLPFYELVETLIDVFQVNSLQGQYAYLQPFQDLVLKFSQNEKGDIHSFLELWEERASKESIKVADDLDAMRILTIHKAKGLEYTSVIVPFCDWEIDHKPSRAPIIWADTSKAPFNVGHLPVKYKKGLNNTYYSYDYENEKIKAHLDNLNLLYVAFTRASNNLWVYAPENKKSIAQVLRDTLDDGNFELKSRWNHQKNIFEFGNREFHIALAEQQVSSGLKLEHYQHFNWRKRITIKYTARGFTEMAERRIKINYGILIHKLLSKLKTMADKEYALGSLYFEEGLNDDQREEVTTVVSKLLVNPAVQPWYKPGWRVYNEMPIITPEDEYRVDRFITNDDRSVIIDYKTGLPKEEDRMQMQQYKILLSTMGYKDVEGYLWYLAEDKVEEV